MGNVYMEADQVRFKNSTYHNLQTAVSAALEGGGGGGTTVIANPEGSATADLAKLQVGTTIYGIPAEAGDISYDNTSSGMTADDVQEAIDELKASIPGVATDSAPGVVQPDGTSITISDGVISAVGSGSGGVNYSTTEHIIGTWVDGSTLYERTYYIDSFPSGGTTTMEKLVDTGFTPSQIAVRYGEGIGYSSSGAVYPLPYLNGGTSTDVQYEIGFAFVSRDSHLYIFLRSAYNYSSVTGYVTMRYTKSA